jgi:hypothetical protein
MFYFDEIAIRRINAARGYGDVFPLSAASASDSPKNFEQTNGV